LRSSRSPELGSGGQASVVAQLVEPDHHDAPEYQRAACELRAGRQLAEQHPGEEDREQDLGHADEGRQLGSQPARGADPCQVGDRRCHNGQSEHRQDPADLVPGQVDADGGRMHRQDACQARCAECDSPNAHSGPGHDERRKPVAVGCREHEEDRETDRRQQSPDRSDRIYPP